MDLDDSEGFPLIVAWRHDVVQLLLAVRGLGALGGVLYSLIYAAGTVVLVSGTMLSLAAGVLYGPFWGTLIVVPASLTGASASFLMARRLGRARLRQWVSQRARLDTLDRAVAQEGFRVILLLRLDPVFLPFAPLNYALGLTGARFRDYFLASWLGMFPASVLYVYLGSLVPRLADLNGGTWQPRAQWHLWMLAVGGAALAAVAVILQRSARRLLGQAELVQQEETE